MHISVVAAQVWLSLDLSFNFRTFLVYILVYISGYLRLFLLSINQVMVGQTICPNCPLYSTSCSSSWGLWSLDTHKRMSSSCQKAYLAKVSKSMRRWEGNREILQLLIYIISHRLKMSFTNRLELSVGNEVLRPNEDRRLVSAVPLRDRMVRLLLTCKCLEPRS